MLTVTRVEVLQGVHNMESSPPSERAAAAGRNDVGDTVCVGVGVDAKRQHQTVRGGAPGCK